ncbi:MAG TPA: hypothetical protein GX532_02190 [Clostridia bacterium]|nr:hypothetical protein [Clostridia bacterium]HHY05772.1 hypothetical protein [Clostridia bacterium]
MEKADGFRSKSGEEALRKLTGLKKTLRAYKIKADKRNLFENMHRNAFTRSWQEIEAIQVPVEHENLDKIFTRAKNNAKVAIKGNSEVNRATFYSSQR